MATYQEMRAKARAGGFAKDSDGADSWTAGKRADQHRPPVRSLGGGVVGRHPLKATPPLRNTKARVFEP